MIFAVVLYLIYFALVAAVLRSVVDRVAKIYMPFRESMMIAMTVVGVSMCVFWMTMAASGLFLSNDANDVEGRRRFELFSMAVGLGVTFIVNCVIFSVMVRSHASRRSIGPGKGTIIAVIMTLIYLATQAGILGFMYIIS